jgi:hypothetical protein
MPAIPNEDYVFAEAVGGFSIAYPGHNEAPSSGTDGGLGSGGFRLRLL